MSPGRRLPRLPKSRLPKIAQLANLPCIGGWRAGGEPRPVRFVGHGDCSLLSQNTLGNKLAQQLSLSDMTNSQHDTLGTQLSVLYLLFPFKDAAWKPKVLDDSASETVQPALVPRCWDPSVGCLARVLGPRIQR
jgi:hypothetical protein